MKNEALDEATAIARSIHDAMPDLRLHGDGTMRDDADTPVHPGTLVTTLYRARMDAEKLWRLLANTERRKSPTRGGD